MCDCTTSAYAAKTAGEQSDHVVAAVLGDDPDLLDDEYLDGELLALWHRLPAEARLLAWLMAKKESDHAASLWE
jgi:hypothetical protein